MTPAFRVWMIARASIQDYLMTWRTPNHNEIYCEAKVYALRQEFGRDWLWNAQVHRGCR